jgi:ATP-dependent helicase/nuclease subunit B
MNTTRIYTIPTTKPFIPAVAAYIDAAYLRAKKDLSRTAVVFGGRRPFLFLNRELSSRADGPFFAPRYFSIDEFIGYCALQYGSQAKISDMDAGYLIYTLARKHVPQILEGRETFARFLPWAQEILGFIEQLDLEDVSGESLKNIESKARIGYDVPDTINTLLEHIIILRDKFHEYLTSSHRYSRGFAYRGAAETVKNLAFDEFDEILFCGFFYLHATELAVIRHVYACGKGVLFFQGSASDWSVLKRVGEGLGVTIGHEPDSQPACDVQIEAGFDVHSQVCTVREIIKTIPNPNAACIVMPEPDNVIPLLAEVSSHVKEFNVSMGYPLRRSSLFSLFKSIFDAQESMKDDLFYARDYLAVLSHPLVKNLRILNDATATRILIHKIEEILTGMEKTALSGKLFFRLEEIEESRELVDLCMQSMKSMEMEVSYDDIKKILRTLNSLLFGRWREVASFAGFAHVLGDCIDTIAVRSPIAAYPLNVRMAHAIVAIRDEFAAATFADEPFERIEICEIFLQQLSKQVVSFSGSPLKGLQILGLFETRSLVFDHVIIMDANETVLPNLQIYEPLIPREVMIGLGLNRLEKEEEIQRYQFRRLIAGAKSAHILYQQRPDKEKSRFIEELIWEKQKAEKSLNVMPVTRSQFTVNVTPSRLSIPKTVPMIEYLTKMTYSASGINTYLDCPLRFYYQYVLGLREREDVLDEMEAADVGTFLHELLEEVFTPYIGKQPVIDAAFRKKFQEILDRRFSDVFERSMKSDAFLLREVINVRMQAFLEHEGRRQVSRIVSLEKEYLGKIATHAGVFACKARIDRIDVMNDSSVLVIDYKSGSADIMPGVDPDRIAQADGREELKAVVKSFQLPLYLHLVDTQSGFPTVKTNAGLYSLRDIGATAKATGMKLLLSKPEYVARKNEIMDAFMDALGRLFSEILNPELAFRADTSSENKCKFCPFVYMCR